MSELGGPVLSRQEIGRRLRAAHEAAGLTLEYSAKNLDTSTSMLELVRASRRPGSVAGLRRRGQGLRRSSLALSPADSVVLVERVTEKLWSSQE